MNKINVILNLESLNFNFNNNIHHKSKSYNGGERVHGYIHILPIMYINI